MREAIFGIIILIIACVLFVISMAGCSGYEKTVSARQIGVTGKYTDGEAKATVNYRVEYR